MQKELVAKIAKMLQAIPAHSDWDIEIVGIDPVDTGLKVVYRDKRSPIQRMEIEQTDKEERCKFQYCNMIKI